MPVDGLRCGSHFLGCSLHLHRFCKTDSELRRKRLEELTLYTNRTLLHMMEAQRDELDPAKAAAQPAPRPPEAEAEQPQQPPSQPRSQVKEEAQPPEAVMAQAESCATC